MCAASAARKTILTGSEYINTYASIFAPPGRQAGLLHKCTITCVHCTYTMSPPTRGPTDKYHFFYPSPIPLHWNIRWLVYYIIEIYVRSHGWGSSLAREKVKVRLLHINLFPSDIYMYKRKRANKVSTLQSSITRS